MYYNSKEKGRWICRGFWAIVFAVVGCVMAANAQSTSLTFETGGLNGGAILTGPKDFDGETLVVPESTIISGKEYKVTEIMASAFSKNASIKKVELPSSIKKLGKNCFWYSVVNEINFPEGFEYLETKILYQTPVVSLKFPSSLTEICVSNHIIDNIPSLEFVDFSACNKISNWKFVDGSLVTNFLYRLPALKEARLPSSVESVGEGFVYSCPELEKMYLYAVEPPSFGGGNLTNFVMAGSNDEYPSFTLYVPNGSVEAYKNSWWGEVKQIKAIEAIPEDEEKPDVPAENDGPAKTIRLTDKTGQQFEISFRNGEGGNTIVTVTLPEDCPSFLYTKSHDEIAIESSANTHKVVMTDLQEPQHVEFMLDNEVATGKIERIDSADYQPIIRINGRQIAITNAACANAELYDLNGLLLTSVPVINREAQLDCPSLGTPVILRLGSESYKLTPANQ